MKQEIPPIQILYVDDDEDDHILFNREMRQIPNAAHALHFKRSHGEAVEWLQQNPCDILFVDFYLGKKTGLELIKEVREMGLTMPAIVLTGQSTPDIDAQSLYGGADDYLEKRHLTSVLLDRTIRYALERERHRTLIRDRQRQLEQLSKKLLAIQEKERKRLARELHDGVSSTLTAVKYALEENIYYQKDESAGSGAPLEAILSWVKQAITETRALCSRLRPETLDDLGLNLAVQSLCNKTGQVSENLEIVCRVELADEGFSEDAKIAVYRIVQEALNNVTKHSAASRVEVSLMETENELILSIEDNGNGFDPDNRSNTHADGGFGLESMKERTELLHGRFELRSEPHEGTLIRCRWPKS